MSDPTQTIISDLPNDKCRCGYSKASSIIAPKNEYSIIGWLLWCVGISSCPRKVTLMCPVCQHVFEVMSDPTNCIKYRYK